MLEPSRSRRCAALLCLHWTLLAAPALAEPASPEPASPEASSEPASSDAARSEPASSEAASAEAETAQPTSPEPAGAAEGQRGRRWYGGQVLIADAAGIAMGAALALGLAVEHEHRPSDLGLVGSAWYGVGAVGAPAVHFAHGRGGAGMTSLATRTLIPPLAGVIGLTVGCLGHGDFEASCRRSGVTGGTLVGLAAAAAYDASVLAYTDAPEPAEQGRSWYGWQLLTLDGALLLSGAVVAARGPRNEDGEKLHPVAALWAPAYLFGLIGGPIVHATHGEWSHALGSLGLRAFVGPLGALAGLMGHCAAAAGVSGCSTTGAMYGLLGGQLFVDLFDALVLGYTDAKPAQASKPGTSVSVAPGFIAISGAW